MIYLVFMVLNWRAGQPVPVAARSKPWVCGPSLPGILGSNPTWEWTSVSLTGVCCQVEVSTSGRFLVQRNPNECVCLSLSVIRCNNNSQDLHLR